MTTSAPGITVERWPIERIKPYKRNAKLHSEEAVKELAESMKEFGVIWPVLVDKKGELIAGHRRHLAQLYNGATEIDVIKADHLTPAQVKAFRLADNRSAERTPWDPAILRDELMALQKIDFPLHLAGFDEPSLKAFLAAPNSGRGDPDAVPALPKNIYVREGDIWTLGAHRLMCGSSIIADDVKALLDGEAPHLMDTDPPYGVDYDPTWRDEAGGEFGDGKTVMRGAVQNDKRADWTEAWRLFPGEVAYVWCASLTSDVVIQSLEATELERRAQIIWRKPHFQISRGHYHWQHECCWYVVRKGGKGHWNGSRKETTVWDIAGMNPAGRNRDEGNEKTEHGTQKPVECMERPMLNNSRPGDSVYDPFSGSGSSIIAGERSGRRVYAMEVDPAYVQLQIERWQAFTGQAATLGGKTFEEVSDLRRHESRPSAAATTTKRNRGTIQRRTSNPLGVKNR